MKRSVFYLSLVVALCSCTPRSFREYKKKGEEVSRLLLEELHHIKNKEQLSIAANRLEDLFEEIVDLMIGAEELAKHLGESAPHRSETDSLLNEQLKAELYRIYCLDGGRERVEKAQEKAMEKWKNYRKHQKIAKSS